MGSSISSLENVRYTKCGHVICEGNCNLDKHKNEIPCRYGDKCRKPTTCPYLHNIRECRYGDKCRDKYCKFLHPDCTNIKNAVIVLIRNGKVLTTIEIRPNGKRVLGLPGGGLDHGEGYFAGAKREFREETNQTLPWGRIGTKFYIRGTVFYPIESDTPIDLDISTNETAGLLWIPIDILLQLINGKIQTYEGLRLRRCMISK